MNQTHQMNKAGKTNFKTALIWWASTITYMGLIYYLSSQQGVDISSLPENFDKIAHVFIYMPLSFLLYISLRKSGLRNYVFVIAVIFAGIYGISDEIHQSIVPGRYPDINDVLADLIGAFSGSLAARFTKTE